MRDEIATHWLATKGLKQITINNMATEYQADVLVTVTNGKESFIITVLLKQSEEYSKISYIRDKR